MGRVKGLLWEWENGGARQAAEAARRCPSCGRKRRLHGRYVRFVVVGGQALEISIPRLFCPARECRKTAAVLPWFLAPRSPYPWVLRQAALVSFLGEEGGYRAAAARFDLDWQLLWAWAEVLADKAKAMLAALAGLGFRYPGQAEGGPVLPEARDLDACRPRARSPAKRESLAAVGALLVTAYLLWGAGRALGLPWGRPDPSEALAFLARLESALV